VNRVPCTVQLSIRRKPAPAQAGGGATEGNAADDALMVDQGRL
jgi:hypothetical protein